MIIHYFLAILTMILYLYSFFPINQNISLKHDPPNKLQDINLNVEHVYNSSINKIVLVVIDALRYDFITLDNTPNILKLIKNDGCLSLVKVESPTVTLPRIKSLTTGSVPQFIDVVLNLLDTESAVDSIMHQAVNKGKKIVFYGDDTWLKLYPGIFTRSEGTSSFYVYDYTEVDNNVTRNVRAELKENDWDIMILHYLGLDHIGHISGPFSPLVKPKLNEMDGIINEIYNRTRNTSRLLVVTGDHGMKDSGGHGGTTYSEMNVPLLLLGQACTKDQISQSDLPAILSTFMGLPFPSNSIGKISTKLLSSLSIEKMLYSLRYNAMFLGNKTSVCKEKFDQASELHYHLLKNNNLSTVNETIELYQACLMSMNSHLLKQSVTQEDLNLIVCIFILIFCLTEAVVTVLHGKNYGHFREFAISIFIFSFFFYKWNHHFIIAFCLVVFSLIAFNVIKIAKIVVNQGRDANLVIFIILHIVHSISMFSSSFIEEEHQTWYFFFTTFFLVITFRYRNVYMIFALVCFGFIRKLNQTGDKWAAEPDISRWLLVRENYVYCHALYVASLVLTGILSCKIYCKNKTNASTTILILILIYIFKIHTINYVFLGQIIWFLILFNFLIFQITINLLINTWILIICVVYRPQNLILIPFTIFTSIILSQQIKSYPVLSILHLWIGNVLYFCQGHSNSLASIDIAAGYVGLIDYKPVYVFLQILCHTYSMPILTNLLLLSCYNNLNVWNIFVIFRLLLIASTYTLAFIQRHHLFIWSVFAPKILLEFSHTVILSVQILLHYTIVFINNIVNKNIFTTYLNLSNIYITLDRWLVFWLIGWRSARL